MKIFISILVSLLVLSCSHSKPPDNQKKSTDFTSIYQKYGKTHFIGIGIGTGANEHLAIKVAKAKALGELADNVKVSIMSKLEIISNDITIGDQSQSSESIREMIITIGNATVRSPEYEIIHVSERGNKFHAEVFAKKLKNEHINESARDLEFLGTDKLLDMLEQ